jgi:hypothetical protein
MQQTAGLGSTTIGQYCASAMRVVLDHPIRAVLATAFLVRLGVALVSYAVHPAPLFPDETQYIGLAHYLAAGRSPEDWAPGYGDILYGSTKAYVAPLALLFEVFGPHRLVGQLLSVAFGTAAAACVVVIALRCMRRGFAIVSGLLVALFPSQALFSAVTLREAEVWLMLGLAGLGAGLLASQRVAWQMRGLLLLAGVLACLGFLREQTLFAAAWSLVAFAVLVLRQGWAVRIPGAIALALVIPVVAGLGVGGSSLIRNTEDLDVVRTRLADRAQSAFEPPPASLGSTGQAVRGDPAPHDATPQGPRKPPAEPVSARRADLGHLPAGLVDVALRPFPWQGTSSLSLNVARFESLLWYLLYGLALVGAIVAMRAPQARDWLLFPVLLGGAMTGIAALTQGNAGTAFRHREQVLWVLALCAAFGLQWLFDRKGVGSPRSSSAPTDPGL